ncbi:hypothetical protein GF340_04150 [Candidatus Peregrinibacteria bacterium]|nr:hypothetical protein [Candidatus Peregrinibacteria bacterium]
MKPNVLRGIKRISWVISSIFGIVWFFIFFSRLAESNFTIENQQEVIFLFLAIFFLAGLMFGIALFFLRGVLIWIIKGFSKSSTSKDQTTAGQEQQDPQNTQES